MSLQQWTALEEEARQRVPNAEGTRYMDVDDRVRDEVCRLFILSNYDVMTLLTNVVQSLQHVGRHDVGLLRNENSTAFTVTQSSAYGRQGADEVERRRYDVRQAIERINAAGDTAERRFNAAALTHLALAPPPKPVPAPQQPLGHPFEKTAYEQVLDSIAATRQASRSPGGRRSASASGANKSRSGRPPSGYNGSYLLRRYGGSYDPQCQYSHYRYHGLPKK